MLGEKFILISIQPRYAEKIFMGVKTVEFRRVFPHVVHGRYMFVYISSPIKAISGFCEVANIFLGDIDDLWNRYKLSGGISEKEFSQYFRGKDRGYCVEIASAHVLDKPIKLQNIRADYSASEIPHQFTPPQNYCYIGKDHPLYNLLIRSI